MPFPKPVMAQAAPERETTRVRFDDDTVGEYYVRGGICWPTIVVTGMRSEAAGYAVVTAVNVRTGRVNVFEAAPFNTISPEIRDGRGQLNVRALGPLLMRWWLRWYPSGYYWHDKRDTSHQFRLQVVRDDSLQPKPRLIEIGWDDDKAAEQVYWLASETGLLAMELATAQELARVPVGEFSPSRHALVCALVGLQRRPYRVDPRRPAYEDEVDGMNLWRPTT